VPPHQNLEGFGVAPLNALDALRVTYFPGDHGLFGIRRPGSEKVPIGLDRQLDVAFLRGIRT
jgi:hypothetical protein